VKEGEKVMRIKRALVAASLLALGFSLPVGCGDYNPPVANAPVVKERPPVTPVPAEIKKGGGKSSSGNMKTMPGEST
jgi:hypothetical protein